MRVASAAPTVMVSRMTKGAFYNYKLRRRVEGFGHASGIPNPDSVPTPSLSGLCVKTRMLWCVNVQRSAVMFNKEHETLLFGSLGFCASRGFACVCFGACIVRVCLQCSRTKHGTQSTWPPPPSTNRILISVYALLQTCLRATCFVSCIHSNINA